jgi:uncharacterized protein (TIGR02145 family)
MCFMLVARDGYFNCYSCKKTDDTDPGIYGSWTDPEDGMVYKTILWVNSIGLAENLNRGEMITGEKDQSDNGIIEKYCYDNNPVFVKNTEVFTNGMKRCNTVILKAPGEFVQPAGTYHLTTNGKYSRFSWNDTRGSGEVLWRGVNQGTVLQTGGESGFEALKSGTRSINGSFNQLGNSGFFWSSTADGANHAWRRGIGLENQGIYRSVNDRSFGFPVRCVKY